MFIKQKVFMILALSLIITLSGSQFVAAAPWWEAHFTKQVYEMNSEFEEAIYDFVMQAEKSVWIASYSWGTSSHNMVIEGLNEQWKAGLDVKVVGDESQPFPDDMEDYPKVTDKDMQSEYSALQHNKIIIIDAYTRNAQVLTGSANFTEGAYSNQNNDAVIVKDMDVANIYADRFSEMFEGNFRSNVSFQHNFTVNKHLVKVYFAPADWPADYLEDAITNAKNSVHFLSFNHLLSEYADAAAALKKRGGIVEGVYQSTRDNMLEIYDAAKVDVRESASTDFIGVHNKQYIVDLETVVTGSLNHSWTSNYNDENIIVIKDFRLAREYMKNFHFVFRQTEPRVSSPAHRTTAPPKVTNLLTGASPQRDGSIYVSWKAVTDDKLAGYYVYVSRTPITDIENLVPEYFIKESSVCKVTTENQNDPIVVNQNYYIAVSTVDWFGNENYEVVQSGPVRANGNPSAKIGEIDFDAIEDDEEGEEESDADDEEGEEEQDQEGDEGEADFSRDYEVVDYVWSGRTATPVVRYKKTQSSFDLSDEYGDYEIVDYVWYGKKKHPVVKYTEDGRVKYVIEDRLEYVDSGGYWKYTLKD